MLKSRVNKIHGVDATEERGEIGQFRLTEVVLRRMGLFDQLIKLFGGIFAGVPATPLEPKPALFEPAKALDPENWTNFGPFAAFDMPRIERELKTIGVGYEIRPDRDLLTGEVARQTSDASPLSYLHGKTLDLRFIFVWVKNEDLKWLKNNSELGNLGFVVE